RHRVLPQPLTRGALRTVDRPGFARESSHARPAARRCRDAAGGDQLDAIAHGSQSVALARVERAAHCIRPELRVGVGAAHDAPSARCAYRWPTARWAWT